MTEQDGRRETFWARMTHWLRAFDDALNPDELGALTERVETIERALKLRADRETDQVSR